MGEIFGPTRFGSIGLDEWFSLSFKSSKVQLTIGSEILINLNLEEHELIFSTFGMKDEIVRADNGMYAAQYLDFDNVNKEQLLTDILDTRTQSLQIFHYVLIPRSGWYILEQKPISPFYFPRSVA